MSAPTGHDVAARRHLHWENALDRLELEVDLAERLLADPTGEPVPDHEPWDEPQFEGPIPAGLAERANAIRGRQRAVEAELVAALSATRRQHRFADRVDRATGRRLDHAVYVDLEA
ncbi:MULTISPECIES: hypothetical protein [unclassified Nocardioides]|uniref:hypothetical protein n=1 Tax=unclassified Nocardioides TaxID=2615069 RepID=UPI0009EFA853|nr:MULTISPECIES: hypothetical protein [unclassified Nocardioides]GAW51208.1 uncharacterized protein PD653B2_3549 [Nocardioides sp. PD653-B2]GAW56936.1 uncharacterized protein PD653_4378 [Nocardioides sp. PD653]